MGIIHISDLRLRAIIGTHAWERKNKQDITLNIAIDYFSDQACEKDQLSKALNYETLVKKISKRVEGSSCYLIEKLGADVLKLILREKGVRSASVRVEKPQAILQAKSISFELYMKK